MTTPLKYRGAIGATKYQVPRLITRAQSMHDGMGDDTTTYTAPNPPLPAFQTLITNVVLAQNLVRTRAVGAAATRDVQRDLLYTAMKTECMYVQTLVDADPGRSIALIQNAGLVLAGIPSRQKAFLSLSLGMQPGSVICDANVRLLVGVGASKPHQNKFFNWEVSVDGGKSYASAPSTSKGKTLLVGLPLLTLVGVRVSLSNGSGQGPWSQTVTILVH